VFPAEQSAEVAEEDDHDRPFGPVVAEPPWRPLGIPEGHVGELVRVHGGDASRARERRR